MDLDIRYEDENIIVVYKPKGLATQTGRVGQQDMVSLLKNHLAKASGSGAPFLGVVHRLDQPVDGLLVFAKDKASAAALSQQLSGGILNKHYTATVCGKVPEERVCLEDYLIKNEKNLAKIVPKDYKGAKKAILYFIRTETLDEKNQIYKLDVEIETGRFHQIRCQLAGAGYPILGDQKYGTGESGTLSAELGVRNVALTACTLEFVHPTTHKKMSFRLDPHYRL
ncbi:MAG: RluA family pseudouridine synthase [Acetatifactor sp.]|nr:RluA family pseudouridine synthase [Acetatifactor sp.]